MLSSVLGDKDAKAIMKDKVLLFTEIFSLKNVLPILFN